MFNPIDEIYSQREDLIIIGLTGRTGSGCSTTAKILATPLSDLNLRSNLLGTTPDNSDRKRNILNNYFKANWHPFFPILVRDIITSFMLEVSFKEFNEFLEQSGFKKLPQTWEKDFKDNKKGNTALIKYETQKQSQKILNTYLTKQLTGFSAKIKKELDKKKQYITLYQLLGDNIRKTGNAIGKGEGKSEYIFSLVKRVENVIHFLKKEFKKIGRKPYFVIDSFRNPFEATYFHNHFTSYYLVAVNCSDEHRINRLVHKVGLNKEEISELDDKEYPKGSPLSSHEKFVSQNISACIQKSDIHIHNKDQSPSENKNFLELKGQIVKYFSLILHPGLVTPSVSEKMMQIAYTAKLNSGCISRQVGAVVTDEGGAIRGIGWNSTPEDQVPCVLRSVNLFLDSGDDSSFSDFELTNDDLKTCVEKHSDSYKNSSNVKGLNLSFCFKDIWNDIKSEDNQVHTRSLHAEENAFLQVSKYGGGPLLRGTLYSTASPCELCSKKAFQLNLKKIVYLDPYPGIAREQILLSGIK